MGFSRERKSPEKPLCSKVSVSASFSRCSFQSFSAAAEEATLSRVFAGQHFRFDLTAGSRLGRDVADTVVDNLLTAREKDEGR